MFIELVDALRCPHPHEESWLVAAADRMDGRNIMEGVLGCPVCKAQFRITEGVADLRAAPGSRRAAAPAVARDPEQAMRLAAFLHLTDGRGYAALVGAWTAHAPDIQAVAETHLLLVNPPAGVRIGAGMSGLLADTRLPVAAGSARGLAVDQDVGADWLASALAGVQAGGRVVAPAAMPLPGGVTQLARDAVVWVAERTPEPSGLVSLGRGVR
ncbi:MAG: hypothetical protein B7Z72_03175 [Gemmatimonadetes bacterium 21-71-4]|nr:MAG: hypothetical protein B7Z72_03175 [Gemmatimonadetes bacterium 21-71-4]